MSFCVFLRYKNGSILQKENVGSVSSLFIADVTGAQGVYTCKAVNEYGSEISNKAVLTVKGNNVPL